MPQHADVIIIGAGISGLTIATELQKHNIPLIILEANAHIGGRCWAKNRIDLGASWVHRCDSIRKYSRIADIDMCKQTSCDSFIDPDVDVVLGVSPHVLREYANIYKTFVHGPQSKTYTNLRHILSTHENSSQMMQILDYHRLKMGFHEPQHHDIETKAYTKDGMPHQSMYDTFIAPLIEPLRTSIRTRTPVQAIFKSQDGFEVHTSRGVYACNKLVYTGTFPALKTIQVHDRIIPKYLQAFMKQVEYINAVKVVWFVDVRSEQKLRSIFNTRRQLHVPGLPWTVMLHEKKGYLYTFAAGPTYSKVKDSNMHNLRKQLETSLGIRITDHMSYDYNKNKYFQASYASLFPDNNPQIQDKLMNPSPNFFMSGDSIVLSQDFDKWEWCMGTVTGAIRTAHYVANLIKQTSSRSKK